MQRLLIDGCLSKIEDPLIFCFPDQVAGHADVLIVDATVSDGATSMDGEVFTFIVTDATGMVLAHETGAAHFADVYPNGSNCGVGCRQANLP